jgi:hypothetical protein
VIISQYRISDDKLLMVRPATPDLLKGISLSAGLAVAEVGESLAMGFRVYDKNSYYKARLPLEE